MTCPPACRLFRDVCTGTRPGLTPVIRAGWRGRRELAPRCSATQLAARRHDPGQTRRALNHLNHTPPHTPPHTHHHHTTTPQHIAHDAPRGPKTPPPGVRPGILPEPMPQRSDRTVRHFAGAALLTLGLPIQAVASGEAMDTSALRFLTTSCGLRPEGRRRRRNVKKLKEEMEGVRGEDAGAQPEGPSRSPAVRC